MAKSHEVFDRKKFRTRSSLWLYIISQYTLDIRKKTEQKSKDSKSRPNFFSILSFTFVSRCSPIPPPHFLFPLPFQVVVFCVVFIGPNQQVSYFSLPPNERKRQRFRLISTLNMTPISILILPTRLLISAPNSMPIVVVDLLPKLPRTFNTDKIFIFIVIVFFRFHYSISPTFEMIIHRKVLRGAAFI